MMLYNLIFFFLLTVSWSFSHVSTCGSTYCSMAGRVGFTCPRYRIPEEQGCTVTLPTPLRRFPPQWQPCYLFIG